ncbi:hypothetical protein SDC9_104836 [bioreactor metagenome]|uniref:Uncharacterized protein n=1 Tax=bioreactor metagenome TaxID=1076179 RepID=A0A645AXW6_9ZZZZ
MNVADHSIFFNGLHVALRAIVHNAGVYVTDAPYEIPQKMILRPAVLSLSGRGPQGDGVEIKVRLACKSIGQGLLIHAGSDMGIPQQNLTVFHGEAFSVSTGGQQKEPCRHAVSGDQYLSHFIHIQRRGFCGRFAVRRVYSARLGYAIRF